MSGEAGQTVRHQHVIFASNQNTVFGFASLTEQVLLHVMVSFDFSG